MIEKVNNELSVSDEVIRELIEKAHKEFIAKANNNRAVQNQKRLKSLRDVALELRDEARKIKNGNVHFPVNDLTKEDTP